MHLSQISVEYINGKILWIPAVRFFFVCSCLLLFHVTCAIHKLETNMNLTLILIGILSKAMLVMHLRMRDFFSINKIKKNRWDHRKNRMVLRNFRNFVQFHDLFQTRWDKNNCTSLKIFKLNWIMKQWNTIFPLIYRTIKNAVVIISINIFRRIWRTLQ